MVCKKCGKKIEGNRLFCPSCGAEVQMVPDYNTIEDELLESIQMIKEETTKSVRETRARAPRPVGTESLQIPIQTRKEDPDKNIHSLSDTQKAAAPDRQPVQRNAGAEAGSYDRNDLYEEDAEWEEEFHLEKKKDTVRQKRIKLISSIVAVSLAIIAVVAIIITVIIMQVTQTSYKKQMTEGDEAWKSGDYESAIVLFENAVGEAEDDAGKAEALCKLAELYVEYGDENSAIYYYEQVSELNKLSSEDLSTLVSLYENKSDLNSIRRLAETYSDEKTEKLFEKHLLNQPVFNYKSGTYNELLTVDITAANNEQIFYTLDNKEATPESTPYTGPLQIGEGTTVVRAIAVNSGGLVSDEIITTYEVKLDVPPSPIITPETGSYSEASKVTLHNIPTNCKAYYTIDGTVPTAESNEYKEAFDMMLGNYVIMAVCINQYTGQSSPVAVKIYDLSINGKISYASSSGLVMSRLQEMGEVLDGDGTMANGEKCMLLPATVSKIGNTDYYIVKRYRSTAAGIKEEGSAYAVDINTGAVFRAQDNGAGKYNLSGL